MLESLAGEGCESLPTRAIFERAETLYLFEVRPVEDGRLQKEVRALRKGGANMNVIAQKLGISRDRVSGLLSS